ncbi:MAG: extracellular solute-binding protein [Clostridia bacterium]|nr:extracellular solute-binding protein [Clostridia bacterium]
MKRFLVLFVLFAMIATSLVGCGSSGTDGPAETESHTTETGQGSESATETEEKQPSRFDQLPAADYGDTDFVILTKDITGSNMWDPVDIWAEVLNGDMINDAIFQRNKMVEEKYHIHVVQYDDSGYATHVAAAAQTGATDYDVVDVNLITTLGSFAVNGYLKDMNSLGALDFTQPYWDEKVNRNISIKNKLYAAVSEITFIDDYATWCLIFNKDRSTAVGVDPSEIYALAKEGNWSIDRMYEYAELAVQDINGDGMDSRDYWGIYTQYEAVNPLLASTGLTAVIRQENGDIVSNLEDENLLDAIQIVHEYMSDKTVQLYAEDTGFSDVWNEVKRQFAGGYGLFFICPVGNINLSFFREMNEEFGILPLPKLSELDPSYTTTMQYNNATAMAILDTSDERAVRASVILEALAAASHETLTEAFYEKVLMRKRVKDEQSAETLDLIFKNKTVDTALLYNWANIGGMFQRIMKNRSFTYASEVASIKESFEQAITDTMDAFSE